MQYFTDKNGDLKPGRKGITLNRTQWDLLLSGIDTLSERLKTVETEKKTVEKTPKKKKYVTASASHVLCSQYSQGREGPQENEEEEG